MAITQNDLDLVRNEFETKLATVTIDQMKAATAIGAYGERFTAVDAQFMAVLSRFDALELRVDALSADIGRRFSESDRRFEQIERRLGRLEDRVDSLHAKLDSRFGWQTFMFAVLGLLVLFEDTIRPLVGL